MTLDDTLTSAQLLLADGYNVALHGVFTSNETSDLSHYFLGRFLSHADGDAWPFLSQFGAVEEVQTRLALHFLEYSSHLFGLEIYAHWRVGRPGSHGGYRCGQKQERC